MLSLLNAENFEQLEEYNLASCPFESFNNWYHEAKLGCPGYDAMVVSSIDVKTMTPNSRSVLIKSFSNSNREFKIIFYSHYNGVKGSEFNSNSQVALLFYWHSLGKQVRLKGSIVQTDTLFSDQYFSSRDKMSQAVTVASNQSQPIKSKRDLIEKVNNVIIKHKHADISRPNTWGGFEVTINEVEFLQLGAYRMSDRFKFIQDGDNKWNIHRLSP